MSDPVRFLRSFSQALSTLALYGPSHPVTARAVESAYRELADLQASTADDRLHLPAGRGALRPRPAAGAGDLGVDLASGASRNRAVGGHRAGRAGSLRALSRTGRRRTGHGIELLGRRLAGRPGHHPIRARPRPEEPNPPPTPSCSKLATLAYSLRDERETVAWVHQEASEEGRIPALEAYGVVQSLSLAMRGGQAMMLPLLELKEFDQYTTTHAINVAVLTMGLAEFLGMGPTHGARVRTGGAAA